MLNKKDIKILLERNTPSQHTLAKTQEHKNQNEYFLLILYYYIYILLNKKISFAKISNLN
jgi:hypothetical protein